jgi:hypothetical protein
MYSVGKDRPQNVRQATKHAKGGSGWFQLRATNTAQMCYRVQSVKVYLATATHAGLVQLV